MSAPNHLPSPAPLVDTTAPENSGGNSDEQTTEDSPRITTSFDSLPTETVHRILEILIYSSSIDLNNEEPHRFEDPIRAVGSGTTLARVTAVCRWLRAIALDDPRLWSQIDLSHSVSWIELAVERARDLPLTIGYKMTKYSVDHERLLSLLQRAQAVQVLIPTVVAHGEYFPYNDSWPSLRYLICQATSNHGLAIYKQFLAGSTHSLTKLVLRNLNIFVDEMSLPALTHMDLDSCVVLGDRQRPSDLLTIAPNLERLYLRRVSFPQWWTALDVDIAPVPHLPHLQRVYIESSGQIISRLMKHLSKIYNRCDLRIERPGGEGPVQLLDLCRQRLLIARDSLGSPTDTILHITVDIAGGVDLTWSFEDPMNPARTMSLANTLPGWLTQDWATVLGATTQLHVHGGSLNRVATRPRLKDAFTSVHTLVVHEIEWPSRNLTSPDPIQERYMHSTLDTWLRTRARIGQLISVLDFRGRSDFVQGFFEAVGLGLLQEQIVGRVLANGARLSHQT
jgi:hypothetical protein